MRAAGALFASPPLGRTWRLLLLGVILVGTAIRLYVAFTSRGVGPDIESYELVRDALASQPLELYSLVNDPAFAHWPYPPGFLPWFLASDWASRLTGLRFDGFVQVAPIAADAALAWIVQAFLGQRGVGDRTRVLAATLVALGPTFGFISGYHGQIDAVTILPAVLGLWLWSRTDASGRAVAAGLLVGLGGAVKPTALIVVLALLPTAVSRREAAELALAAAAVPLALFSPWLVADLDGVVAAVRANNGVPGFGGLSLAVQPELSGVWLGTKAGVTLSSASKTLLDASALVALAALLATAIVLIWRRVPAVHAATVLWLAFYAFGVNFALQYLVAGVPFFLMAGRVRAVLVLEAAVLVPTALLYGIGSRELPLHRIYTPMMLAVAAGLVVWYALELRRTARPRMVNG